MTMLTVCFFLPFKMSHKHLLTDSHYVLEKEGNWGNLKFNGTETLTILFFFFNLLILFSYKSIFHALFLESHIVKLYDFILGWFLKRCYVRSIRKMPLRIMLSHSMCRINSWKCRLRIYCICHTVMKMFILEMSIGLSKWESLEAEPLSFLYLYKYPFLPANDFCHVTDRYMVWWFEWHVPIVWAFDYLVLLFGEA